ncbi:MAG: hypothetical protein ACO3SE_09255 [Sedimenticolaceae bacterium]
MAIQVTHATTAVGTEAGDGEIGKAEWNADHSLSMATDRILGRTTAGAGSPEELTTGSGLTLASGSLDVAGYKYLGRINKGTGTSEVSPITGTFRDWQAQYQRMKVVLTTNYTSNMYYSFFWKNGSSNVVGQWSFCAWGNTGSYARTIDATSQSYMRTIWYTYHLVPVVTFDLVAQDGNTIADSTYSRPRLRGTVYGSSSLYVEDFYYGVNADQDITSNGLYITTSSSSVTCTLDAWGL